MVKTYLSPKNRDLSIMSHSMVNRPLDSIDSSISGHLCTNIKSDDNDVPYRMMEMIGE